jgi:hypothetical protein
MENMMKKYCLTLIAAACLCMAPQATAKEIAQVDLPEYAGKFYLTVVYEAQTTRENSILYKFMEQDPAMKSLASQCTLTLWTTESRWVKSTQWQKFLGGPDAEYPCILLQAPPSSRTGKAKTIVFLRGKALLGMLNNLPGFIQDRIIDHAADQGWTFEQACPGRRCPRRPNRPYQPTPKPRPTPKVDVTVAPDPVRPLIPTIKINAEEAEDDSPIPLVALLLIPLAVGGALWQEFNAQG